jgi:hypothetical protein
MPLRKHFVTSSLSPYIEESNATYFVAVNQIDLKNETRLWWNERNQKGMEATERKDYVL